VLPKRSLKEHSTRNNLEGSRDPAPLPQFRSGGVLVFWRTTRRSAGTERFHQGNKTQRSACRRGTKVPAPSCGFAGAAPGEDVMAKLINELLLLTCMGAFIASATYAVTLLH
jgi:hypothetical protein